MPKNKYGEKSKSKCTKLHMKEYPLIVLHITVKNRKQSKNSLEIG